MHRPFHNKSLIPDQEVYHGKIYYQKAIIIEHLVWSFSVMEHQIKM